MHAYIPCAAELVELATAGEDDERHLGVAEHGELVGLLEEAIATLGEGHLAVDLVLDPLQLHPAPPHLALARAPRSPVSSWSPAQIKAACNSLLIRSDPLAKLP